jgi:hypothetical protein
MLSNQFIQQKCREKLGKAETDETEGNQNANEDGSESKSKESNRKDVQIRVIEVSWLNSKIPEFFNYLSISQNQALYDNELIKTILQEQNYYWQMVGWSVAPNISYMVLLLYYFINEVPRPRAENSYFFDAQNPLATTVRVLISANQLFLLLIEYLQVRVKKFSYFIDYWNLI